jgi:hypothetical protein
MGYGLINVAMDNNKIVDLRFKHNGFLAYQHDVNCRWSWRGYQQWLRKRYARSSAQIKCDNSWQRIAAFRERHHNLSDYFHIHYRPGGAIFMVIPVGCLHDWIRRDNVIDMVEFSGCPEVMELESNSYPWVGEYWDVRDGRVLESNPMINFLQAQAASRDNNRSYYADGLMDEAAQQLGFDTATECALFAKPRPPESVQWICKYCHIFSSREVIWSLRAMIHTYTI